MQHETLLRCYADAMLLPFLVPALDLPPFLLAFFVATGSSSRAEELQQRAT